MLFNSFNYFSSRWQLETALVESLHSLTIVLIKVFYLSKQIQLTKIVLPVCESIQRWLAILDQGYKHCLFKKEEWDPTTLKDAVLKLLLTKLSLDPADLQTQIGQFQLYFFCKVSKQLQRCLEETAYVALFLLGITTSYGMETELITFVDKCRRAADRNSASMLVSQGLSLPLTT